MRASIFLTGLGRHFSVREEKSGLLPSLWPLAGCTGPVEPLHSTLNCNLGESIFFFLRSLTGILPLKHFPIVSLRIAWGSEPYSH